MIKTYKVMLCPNNKQQTKLFQNAGTARFIYNWTLSCQQKNYESGGKFLSDYDLRKILTQLKQTDNFRWLNNYSNNVAKQAVKDACDAYKKFFKGLSAFPRFKSKKKSKLSFYVDTAKVKITATHVKLEKLTDSRKANRQKLNWVKLAEHDRIPVGAVYSNPRVTFDGLHWWLSVGVECAEPQELPSGEGVGIDIGIKDLAVCSDGNTYTNINKTRKIKRLRKGQRRQQRRVFRKYLTNKKGESYCKTCNIRKAEHQLLKLNRQLTNIRHTYLHQVTSEITNRKPMFVVLEDLKLSERTYVCPICGNSIDRDFQASVNLKRYGESIA